MIEGLVSPTVLIVIAVIVVIWVAIEAKRLKHKLFAFLLIGLILFTYISFTVVIQKHDIDLTTVSGMIEAGGLYFSWLGSIVTNIVEVTAHAINLDWSSVNSSGG
jgi:disulfide bond formation protein DsbB